MDTKTPERLDQLERYSRLTHAQFARFCYEFYRCAPAAAAAAYTRRQLNYFFKFWQQAELERQDRMQWAVTSAIGHTLGGVTATFASLYYQTLFEREQDVALKEFPYDQRFLSEQELYRLSAMVQSFQHEAWPRDRIDAAKSRKIVAKRAAHSPFLWARYQEQPEMSLETLKLWFRIEQLEGVLAVPVWYRQQHASLSEADLGQAWRTFLGDRRAGLEDQHREIMHRLINK